MLKVSKEVSSLDELHLWQGATSTRDKIIKADKEEEFMSILEEMYPEGIDETELNDFMWFDDEQIYKMLQIK